MRLTLSDVSNSRIPQSLGLCAGDYPRLASYVNEIQQRLIFAGGETGWWGGYWRVGFNVSKSNPYITTPRTVANLVSVAVCRAPIRIENQWYEFLWAGSGIKRPCVTGNHTNNWCGIREGYDRNTVVTAYDLPTSGQSYIRAYLTDARDINKRVLFSGALDSNGVGIYSQDVGNSVDGFYLVLNQPFVTTPFTVSSFTNVKKDETYGDVVIVAVNSVTGVETLLSRYVPSETNPVYRRLYLDQLPSSCCPSTVPGMVQVEAMAKLEWMPVSVPSDYLIIGNLPALKAEAESLRFSEMDNPSALAMSMAKHREAIKHLQNEQRHYEGETRVAVGLHPFGTATLERAGVGLVW